MGYHPSKLGRLSEAIRKFYSRKGKRVVFANGQTLNALSWNMCDRLGGKGVDASVVSRVINGQRLFTSHQVRIFCDVLDLPDTAFQRLLKALRSDWLDRLSLPHSD